ncbi:hypoxanthine phosphoribosyltransferase [Alkalispirochaeta sphaeroplastigenens]|uniref:Hypoxanthine phosphoribosyltransferase n=1 Tax=Alkalispirochaeta sphaeroplastigenens TaxID=1187066 RepID=A0A2S4JYT8_9SPIO|nr:MULTISPECIES: hypoxanthine phosphoribosyltransferase [Alkalispirochaeta]POR04671.1 hypoxanthine phosphoribosyltransferase [Alkalispirochaeta sphaeroplastigenens]
MDILISEEKIEERVRELAREINRDYQGRNVLLVGLLKGSFVFLADLVRHLTISVEVDFMAATSYVGTQSTGNLIILKNLNESVHDRHVLIVEDIIDTGLTLSEIRKRLLLETPASLEICTLLDKPAQRKTQVPVKYVGFSVGDQFVVGYGIDHNEQYRTLPYVGVVTSPE